MIHALKIFPEYFEEVRNGRKKFELRYNDRDFRVGDYLALNEWENDKYSGRSELVKVTYVLDPNDIMTRQGNFVVMSIEICGSYDSVPEDTP